MEPGNIDQQQHGNLDDDSDGYIDIRSHQRNVELIKSLLIRGGVPKHYEFEYMFPYIYKQALKTELCAGCCTCPIRYRNSACNCQSWCVQCRIWADSFMGKQKQCIVCGDKLTAYRLYRSSYRTRNSFHAFLKKKYLDLRHSADACFHSDYNRCWESNLCILCEKEAISWRNSICRCLQFCTQCKNEVQAMVILYGDAQECGCFTCGDAPIEFEPVAPDDDQI